MAAGRACFPTRHSTKLRPCGLTFPRRWDSLKESEKALPANISVLVLWSESIITKDAMSVTDTIGASESASASTAKPKGGAVSDAAAAAPE